MGTIVEYATNYNVFYEVSQRLAIGGFVIPPKDDSLGVRANTVGPTAHGLAITTMLGMALPFALFLAATAARRIQKGAFLTIAVLCVAGGLATERRTAVVLPVIAIAVMALAVPITRTYILRAVVALAVVIALFAPSAATQTYERLAGKDEETAISSQGRSSDFEAIRPVIEHRAVLGQGVGAFPNQQRIFDNAYLGLLVGTGVVGVLAYIGVLGSMVALGWRRLRDPNDADGRGYGGALLAALAAYIAANALFDTLTFPQAPYALLMLVALVGISAGAEASDQ